MRVLTRFMAAASDVSHFPAPTLPEIAFLGRSNVGKSSVINSLLGSKVARTSSTPGRTRSINFFEVRFPGKPQAELVFTDLPGYGYAKISREVSAQWPSFIEPYLRERTSLRLCLALLDVNVPLQESDKQLIEFLEAFGRPCLVVATKSDRLSGNQLRNAVAAISKELQRNDVLAFSARTGDGREQLWKHIREAALVPPHRDSLTG